MSDALKRAKKKYVKENVTRFTIDFYPTEQILIDMLKSQPQKQTYIKQLIWDDIIRKFEEETKKENESKNSTDSTEKI